MPADPLVIDLGRRSYEDAYAVQCEHHELVLAARNAGEPVAGTILLVEHDPPVITVSRRASAGGNLIATAEQLARAGVTVAQTDRGGDITYHGPGQLIAYPILDLNHLGLGLHDYMRLLEAAVIDACGEMGLAAQRDICATGVWVPRGAALQASSQTQHSDASPNGCAAADQQTAKICAMGVRIRRWISMHGLALNVTTNLDHFRLIVPCGLIGRPVTSLQNELGDRCPPMAQVKSILVGSLSRHLAAARSARATASSP